MFPYESYFAFFPEFLKQRQPEHREGRKPHISVKRLEQLNKQSTVED
jgi:hypothetical protein